MTNIVYPKKEVANMLNDIEERLLTNDFRAQGVLSNLPLPLKSQMYDQLP